MAIPALIQNKIGLDNQSGTALPLSFNASVSFGNAVVGAVNDGSGGTAALTSVTDDKGNVYNIVNRSADGADGVTLTDFYLTNITNSPTTLTAHFSPSQSFTRILIAEYTNIASVSALNGTASNIFAVAGTAANSVASGTFTTTVAGDLIWGAWVNATGSGNGLNPGSGFTQESTGSIGDTIPMGSEYLVQGTAGSIQATWTPINANSVSFNMVAFALKAGAGAVAANIGKIAPYLFRPNVGPQRGFHPNFAYPTYPAPAPGVVSLFGLSAVQAKMLSQVAGKTSLFSSVKGPLVKAAPSIMASVTTLLSRSPVMSTLRAASLTTANMQALITRGVAQVQARLAQPTGQTSLFGRAKGPAIQGRAAPSVTAQIKALTGRVASMFTARAVIANTPTLIWHIGSTINDTNSGSIGPTSPAVSDKYIFNAPNISGLGNCLALRVSYPYSATRTITLTDSAGDTWPAASITTGGSSAGVSRNQSIFVLKNCSAAAHNMTVQFDAAVTGFQYSYSEFYNVDQSNPVDGTVGTSPNVSGPNISSGSFTPTTNNNVNGGHLILAYTVSDDIPGSGGGNLSTVANPISASGSANLLDADNTCPIPSASSYFVQATNGTINPGFTISQLTTTTNFICSAIALKAANAGTPPPNTIYVQRIQHITPYQQLNAGSGTIQANFPCSGNLLVVATDCGTNIYTLSSVSDSLGQTYTEPAITGGAPQVYYKTNANSSAGMSVNLVHTQSGSTDSLRLFDIANAAAFDTQNSSQQTQSGTVVSDMPDLTPNSAPGITIATVGWGGGPATSLASGSPTGAFFDVVNYTNENDNDHMDSADGVAHFYHSTTATQTWNWNAPNSNGSTVFGTAISFKSAAPQTLGALIARAVAMVRARFTQPTGTTRLVGRTAAMVAVLESPTITRSLSARGDISTFSRAVSSAKTALAALANASPAKARLAQAIGASSLFARAASQVTVRFTQSTGTVKLLARSVVQSKVVATLVLSNVIQLLARSMLAMQGEASIAVTTVLHAATAITVKSAQTLTAQAALTRALIGTTSAKITARLAPLSTAFLTTRINVQSKTPSRPTATAPLSVVAKIMTAITEGSGFSSGFSSGFGSLFLLTANLFSQAVAQVKALPAITAQSPLSRALAGATKTMITGRLAQASGFLALQARTAIQVKATETLTVVSPLARALTNATKAMVTARLAQASGALALQARTAVQVKVAETLTAAAPLTSALTGVGKAVVTAAGSIVGFKFLSSRTAAQTRARVAATVQTALAAAATIAAQARLTQPLAKVALAARTALQTQAQPLLVAAQAIFGRAAIQARSRLNSASRMIYLGAQVTVTVTGRLAQPTGKVLLSGFTAVAVKVKPRIQAVGNMLALSPGLATTMFRAGLSSATFRSIATRAVTSLGSFYTAITSITSTFASTIFGEPAVTTSIAGNLAASSGGMAVVAISQLGGPVMATGPTVTGQISIALGTTVQFSTVFNANPPGAVVNISYFQNDTLTTGSGPIPMVFQSGTTWTAQWDSGVSDGGRVDWSMHTTGGEPVLVQNGYFFLASNDATVTGL